MDPIAFQTKWRAAAVNLKERTASQSHFNDLCALVGVPNPIEADPLGDTYTFEKGAGKAGGGDGWADVWYRGRFGWEYKGYGRDLDAAYLQLLRYKDALENPPLMVVCDLDRIEIRTNFTNSTQHTEVITLEQLSDPGRLEVLRRVWTDPAWFRPETRPEDVTKEAAARFGEIAAGLHRRGVDPTRAAHALMQLLFCLFAEDTGLLPTHLFTRMLDHGVRYPARFRAEATALLEAMNTGDFVAYEKIPHINGGLFRHVDVPELDETEIRILREAATLDWSSIEPAIFGTLFERSLDPAKRSQLGAHYTGRHDIERVVDPVVMAPLRRRWDDIREAYESAEYAPATKEDRHPEPKRSTSNSSPVGADSMSARSTAGRSSTRRRNALLRDIDAFLEELRGVRVLDPACGSGNFLYVALDRLLNLEKEVRLYRATQAVAPLGFPGVRPEQMLGLEINEYAQQLAQVAIWIGYLQWMMQNGFGWSEPVLGELESIRLQDALLTTHEDGTVTETAWPEADFIIGNPPFLGAKRMRAELGDRYTDLIHKTFKGTIPPFSDFVSYFFEKTRAQIEQGGAKRAGLLATNSIRGGSNRVTLERIKESGDIYMAWDDEPWVLDGAAVRISIVGFDDGTESEKLLNGAPVVEITSSLTGSVDVAAAKRLPENTGVCFLGVQLSGPFDMPNDVAHTMLAAPPNPNGRTNHDVVRPMINGMDITRRPREVWIADFGVDTSEEEAALYELPFEHVQTHVKPMREKSRSQLRDKRWWLTLWSRPEMREAVGRLNRYIATPTVSKHRLFKWVDPSVLANHAVAVFAREDDYFFGVLHSRAHEVWSLRMGTWLGKGNDPRYTPTTCFETFPLPWPPGTEPVDDPRVSAIGDAAKRLDELRERWLNPEGATETELKKRTLTNLYNARPTWLRNAHAALDRAVWDAYGWPADEDPAGVEEDVILSRLLALNGERAES